MHELRRFVQEQLDANGWRQADLVRKSGLSRQYVSKLLNDDRDHLGQMPSDEVLEAIAKALPGVSIEMVRTAAARALRGYAGDDADLVVDLKSVSLDALLTEIKRRNEKQERELKVMREAVHRAGKRITGVHREAEVDTTQEAESTTEHDLHALEVDNEHGNVTELGERRPEHSDWRDHIGRAAARTVDPSDPSVNTDVEGER